MSANDEVKLPVTVEEYRRALRDAFADGYGWCADTTRADGVFPSRDEARDEARRRYPIRKKVPREITIGALRVVVDDPGVNPTVSLLPGAGREEDRHYGVWFPLSDAARLAEFLANPFEEVEE